MIKKNINGILLLDKPMDMTSNAALQAAKKIYQAKKAGHTGSLDPIATGMLPLCFGEATKFSQYLLNADKVYQVTAKLGTITASGDAEGDILETRPVGNYTLAQIEAVLTEFRGNISQVPSMFSALKHQGQPLYKLARQGIVVERQARPVSIYELSLLDFQADEISFRVHCSKGTYIRTLIEDIGLKLGCGGHVIALRRLAIGCYDGKQMISLDTLEQWQQDQDFSSLINALLPIESALAMWPIVNLSKAACFYMQRGQPIRLPETPKSGWVRLLHENEFFGIGEIIDDGRLAPRRLINARIAVPVT